MYDFASYKSLLSHVLCNEVQLFIYDNSKQSMHEQSAFESTFIHYIADTTNPGVSTGYNKTVIFARDKDFDKLLLLERDSCFESDSDVEDCARLANAYPAVKLSVPIVITKQMQPMLPQRISV